MSDQSRFVVTLVHGTFASNAAWTRPDSTVCTTLRARFGERLLIDTTKWSGWNTFRARRMGAEALRDAVLKSRPDLPHFIIAHSHAGNIATYSARDPVVNRNIAGIVTLATPFIVARRRNLGQTGRVTAIAFAGLCYFAAVGVVRFFWPVDWADMWMSWVNVLFVPLAIALAVQMPVMRLLKRWSASCERMLAELQHGGIDRERFLIIRAVADEATGGITFLLFPSLAITFLLGKLARFTDSALLRYGRLAQRRVLAVLSLVGSLLLAIPVGIGVGLIVRSGWAAQAMIWTLMALFWGPVFALLFGQPRLARVLVATPLAVLAIPAVGILAVTSLALGPRLALANLYLDVSVEATPVGRHDVILMNPPASGDPDRPGGMLHSALYDDEETIELICDFIAARMAALATVPRETVHQTPGGA